uniref:Uncharacterized protein n=1 Tax=Arion vulgaris TaxID=1028688 RepID=A0A0B7AKU7_9EUPU
MDAFQTSDVLRALLRHARTWTGSLHFFSDRRQNISAQAGVDTKQLNRTCRPIHCTVNDYDQISYMELG